MTPENESLVRDARALIRESMHVKRAAGWGDFVNQLIAALERSEERCEALERRINELQAPRAISTTVHPFEEDYVLAS